MLPTNNKSKLFLDEEGIYTKNRVDNSILRHHLYITSGDGIKQNEWFISLSHKVGDDFTTNTEIAQRLISENNPELFEGWINGVFTSSLDSTKIVGNYDLRH